MNICKHFRFFFVLILLNFLVALAMWACCHYYNNDYFCSWLLICLVVLVAINFLAFRLFCKVIKNRNKLKEAKNEFADKIQECFSKIAESYNLIEASKISLGVYHDLANILTALNLALYEISHNLEKPSELKKLIKQAKCINQRANNLIKSFKHQCQKESNRELFSLSEEIKKSLLILNFSFIKNKIELDLKIKDNIKVFGDAIKFGQVLINLISNAIDSFSGDSVSRKVSLILESREGQVFVSVEDNGSGISPDDLKEIFKPFFSLKDNLQANSGNKHCGIGLSLAKKIIEDDFLGQLLVESTLGQGSKFILIIPMRPLER